MNNRMIYLPFGILAILLLAAVLWVSVTLLFFGALSTAFTKMGFSWSDALLLLAFSLVGAGMNLPLFTMESKVPVVRETFIRSFGMVYRVPVVKTLTNETTVAVNVGGALIPVLVSTYLLVAYPQVAPFALVGTVIVALVTNSVARPIKGLGIATPLFIPPLAAALSALVLTAAFCPIPECRFVTAYVGGVLGTLIGADLLNLNRISDLGAPVASIGGAGTFDGIFMTGVIAVLIV
ncbi:MAG: DUF1614 domain-containing protein [Methanothrix sp.]|jgi:uncharacterized membrane protein|uniref:DUF1614 domain-containing protein n=1 Tax=Methanothrix harundinacea TaxID=301375 RepID=A0A101FT68_9EURY|nr:MAG: Uncharacterized protein XD72_1733 [Methanothrix harundinacea]MDD2639157.1 DUF1614 domain-containing protein [Methanothrix sp.]MDI9399718.1 DUF1614 domain-containing protein [Euryarchaeota archaeon]KUK97653.1 MAG: Uncharacterized protein XE07_0067 [Methanothrix harundinacea]MCP1391230.1 DUF1614 domain-containing protein [Methanothrix harundinacea]